jgi:FtsH-binding integral membrane protein
MLSRRVLVLVIVGLVGTAVELWLLAHDEDFTQWIPFCVIAVALAASVWLAATRSRSAIRAAQVAMLLLIVTGAVGVVLHYRANMEFQLESDRSLSGFPLMMKILEAKAPPALAPGNLSLLGLIGWVAVSRYSSGG